MTGIHHDWFNRIRGQRPANAPSPFQPQPAAGQIWRLQKPAHLVFDLPPLHVILLVTRGGNDAGVDAVAAPLSFDLPAAASDDFCVGAAETGLGADFAVQLWAKFSLSRTRLGVFVFELSGALMDEIVCLDRQGRGALFPPPLPSPPRAGGRG